MAKSSLLRVMALGAVISVSSGAGIFAVFTDRATTGINTVESDTQPHLALKLAPQTFGTNGEPVCGSFSDDLTSPLMTAGLVPGGIEHGWLCLTSTFDGTLNLSATAIDLSDLETVCSGDEAQYDQTCVAGGVGELSGVLTVNAYTSACQFNSPVEFSDSGQLDDLAAGANLDLGNIGGGQVWCLHLTVLDTAWDWLDQQITQRDQATWRFAFDVSE